MTLFVPISGRREADRAPGTVRLRASVPALAARPAAVAAAVSRSTVGAVLAVQLGQPGGWGSAAWIPLVAGLLLGLPHGAVDHLVPGFRLGRSVGRAGLVTAAYAVLALVVLVAFRTWPGPALALFVLVSVVHFGAGETAFHDLRAGRPPRVDVLGAAAFGCAVLVLPILHHRDAVAPVIALVVPGSTGVLPSGPSLAGEVAVLLLVAAAVAVRAVRGQRGPAAELVLLTVAALVVPAPAFFGAYFGTWHSGRHTARLVAEDPANAADLAAGRLGRPLLRFARTAALPTAAALGTVVALWAVAGGWQAFVAADLSVLAALTVPHVLVVAWLDAQQRSAWHRTCQPPTKTSPTIPST